MVGAGALGLLTANPNIAETVITHRIPIDEAAEAFRVASDRTAGSMRLVIESS